MDWPVTLALIAAVGALTAFCGWRGARLPDFARGPRMIPWRFLMILLAFVLILLLVHAANLAGITTGGAQKPGG